jgi:hypothetical protein
MAKKSTNSKLSVSVLNKRAVTMAKKQVVAENRENSLSRAARRKTIAGSAVLEHPYRERLTTRALELITGAGREGLLFSGLSVLRFGRHQVPANVRAVILNGLVISGEVVTVKVGGPGVSIGRPGQRLFATKLAPKITARRTIAKRVSKHVQDAQAD